MIVCIICLTLIFISIALPVVSSIVLKRYNFWSDLSWTVGQGTPKDKLKLISKKYDKWDNLANKFCLGDSTAAFTTCITSAIFGIVMLIIIICCMACHRLPRFADAEYKKLVTARETIVAAEIVEGNTINEFNNLIIDYQRRREDPWVNWFVDPRLGEIELIKIENGEAK